MAIAQYHVPIYGGIVKLCTTREDFLSILEEHDEDSELNVADCCGISKFIYCEEGEGPVYAVGVFDEDLLTVVHEFGHIAVYIADHAGWQISEATTEPFSYLLEELVRLALPSFNFVTETNRQLSLPL